MSSTYPVTWSSGSASLSATPPHSQMLHPASTTLGEVAFLSLDKVGADSIIWGDTLFSPGADKHPVCVIGLSPDRQTATCCGITSFGGKTIQDKYSHRPLDPKRQHYLAIDDGSTVPHNDLPVLRLDRDKRMAKQSYLHVDNFFRIETRYLEQWRSGAKKLDAPSLEALHAYFRRFIAGEVPLSFKWLSPMHVRTYSAAELGVPPSRPGSNKKAVNPVAELFRQQVKSTIRTASASLSASAPAFIPMAPSLSPPTPPFPLTIPFLPSPTCNPYSADCFQGLPCLVPLS